MSENLYNHLIETLKSDERVVSQGEILKNKVLELVYSGDNKLISILVSDDECRDAFFQEAAGSQIFLKEDFIDYLTNKQYFQSSYTKYRNKIGLKTEDGYVSDSKNLELAWPYKDCILEAHQSKEDEKRTEKFWNKTLEKQYVNTLEQPKCLTNFSRHTEQGKENVGEISQKDNLFIRGNNLFALYSLLPRYRNKIKLVYLDPPYNTGSDSFKYNDNFNESTWLTFMKNRLEIIKELLSENGAIFVQIDENEQAELKILMNEIFGEDNFVNRISVKMSNLSGQKMAHIEKTLPKLKESIFVYANEQFKYNVVETKREDWNDEYSKFLTNFEEEDYKIIKDWEKYGINKIRDILEDVKIKSLKKEMEERGIDYSDESWKRDNAYRIVRKSSGSSIKKLADEENIYECEKEIEPVISEEDNMYLVYTDYTVNAKLPRMQIIFAEDNLNKPLGDMWTDIPTSGFYVEGGVKLNSGKKPEVLMKRIVEMATEEQDIVMDCFLGSGTTAAVAHKMGRQYIGVEQLDYGDTDPTVRLKNVIEGDQTGISDDVNWNGGGEFVYAELKKLNATYIKDIQSADSHEELDELHNRIFNEALLSYYVNKEKLSIRLDDFESLGVNQKKEVLTDILDENQFYLNYTDIEDSRIGLSEEKEKELNYQFYGDKDD